MKHINEFESLRHATRRRARRKGIKVKIGNVTVKIYFDAAAGNRKPYRVMWTGAGGAVCREMFATLDEARTFAEKTAADLNNGQRPYTREEIDKLFQLEGRVRQWEEQLKPLRRTLEQVISDVLAAAQILPGWTCSQMATEIRKRHATIKRYLLASEIEQPFIDSVLSGYKRTYSPNYVAQLKREVREFLVKFGARRIDLIAPDEIRDYIAGMRVKPRSRHSADIPRDQDGLIPAEAKTKEAVYNCLAALFRHARDVLQALPAEERTAVERAGRPGTTAKIPQIYLPGEIEALFVVLPDIELVLFVAVQVYAGLRPCEAADLLDTDIAPDENGVPTAILVRHQIAKKSARPDAQVRTRKAPITPPLAALLKKITLPKGRLFSRSDMQKYALEYLRQAGVSVKHDGFRHTWVSYRLETIKERGQVALEAGHTTTVQMDCYEGLVLPKHVKPYWSFAPKIDGLLWHVDLPSVDQLRKTRAPEQAKAIGAGQ